VPEFESFPFGATKYFTPELLIGVGKGVAVAIGVGDGLAVGPGVAVGRGVGDGLPVSSEELASSTKVALWNLAQPWITTTNASKSIG
jgi:hypothetical protein